ncbi:probable methyltransferase TCM_000336 [Juglans microcarpa x Juglans regia]|uniref:probable methyltransferase TCM_000336 n=1 Tax=Juglans microcarpa x Juglans regia TaxID=2249226 RepID=UPI001B7DCDE7|nr:probable methyltransferase TCM_000336 [Juglans microcarpa x Juglans regia]
MNVEKVFHMNGGIGVTSYAENSSLQKRGSDMVKHLTTGTVLEIFLSTTPKSLGIADLGCSSGHNSLTIIKDIVEAVQGTSSNMLHPTPEFRVYLNDLPTNDFNSIFKALPEFYKGFEGEKNGGGPSIFIGGYAGSFYRRLFPNNCLHFVYSSYSLHWLSRVPPALYDEQNRSINKGNIYISESSPPLVSEAYFKQFQDDFNDFLCSRSQELVVGGRMVLILLGRESQDHVDRGNSFFWELLSRSLAELVSKGEVDKEKLDSYEVHFYAPSKNEIEDEVRKEGSFKVDRIEMFEIERDHDKDGRSYGTAIAMTVRAIQESMICHHFGEGILDNLFEIYGRMVDEEMAVEEIRPITFAVVLRKL